MRRLLLRFLGVLAAGVLVCWRATLRVRVEDDPRPGLRAAGRRYVYAILHAQQLSFILLSDDVPILAMVSASRDGDWLVPTAACAGSSPCGARRGRGERTRAVVQRWPSWPMGFAKACPRSSQSTGRVGRAAASTGASLTLRGRPTPASWWRACFFPRTASS